MSRPTDLSCPAPAWASSVDDALDVLRQNGDRITSSRRHLLHVLFQTPGHQTAEQLAARVQHSAPDVHLSTIYRNLEELERLGIVAHTHPGHGPATYHVAVAAHGHFVCADCGDMMEVPGSMFTGLARSASSQYGFQIDPQHFAVLGRCRRCSDQP
ncbi:MAG: Fur family transcriptional regulator [Acidimicrobiales bacterium]